VRTSTGRRLLALFAAVWTGGFLAVYLNTVMGQGTQPATWYLLLLALAIGLLIAAASQPARSWALAAALVVLGLATLAGLLSIGLGLVPADLLAAASLVLPPRAGRSPT
jgi:hypothetical protein